METSLAARMMVASCDLSPHSARKGQGQRLDEDSREEHVEYSSLGCANDACLHVLLILAFILQ
jgi:hypothetical protein